MDTLVNECITVLLASEHAMLALDADEIPPGLLVIGGVAGAAAERARADLQQMRGKDHRVRVVSSPQPNGIKAEWLELRHSVKDVQLLEVVDQMRRAIWRVFGVMPVELGVGDSTPRALAEVQVDVSSSHLIAPILDLLQARINAQVLPLLLGADAAECTFAFDRAQPLTPEQRLALARAQDAQVRRGIITVNEARATLGLLPVDGGDTPVMDTNEGPRPLTQVVLGAPPAAATVAEQDAEAPTLELALADLSAKTQQLLRDKAEAHNDTVKKRGLAEWRRTNARTLAVVYDRGIGAYNGNPESVRPSVTSAHQWAVARVNGWLNALLTDKFKRGSYDTDLLPKQHPLSSKGKRARAVVGRVPKLPRAPLDTPWGWEAGAQAEVLGDPPSWQRYARAHLWRDPQRAGQRSGYKFPIARMVDGELQLVFRGAAAVVGALQRSGKHESLEGVSLEQQRAIYQRVRGIYDAFGQDPPTIDRLEAEQRSPACRQPGEPTSDCVARKVPELVAEGYPQRQAVAIAASLCDQLCSAQRVAERYSHINLTPPKAWWPSFARGWSGTRKATAATGWWLRRWPGRDAWPTARTFRPSARLMRAWLARHEVDKQGKGFRPGEDGYPSPGRVAWALWGGDPAVPWSSKLVDQLDAADDKAGIKRDEHQHGHSHGRGHGHDCGDPSCSVHHGPLRTVGDLERLQGRGAEWLPSGWPEADRFDGYRTIDLAALAEVVEDYGRAVTGLYRDASLELQAILLRAYGGDRVLDPMEAQRAQVQMLDRLDQLAGDWSVRTRPFYQRAAQLAVDSASAITDQPVDTSWRVQADDYHRQAMAYLVQPNGLVGTLQAQVRRIVSAATLGTRDRIDDLDPDDGPVRTTQVLAVELSVQAVRIDNWSGRLVGLANAQLVAALDATVTPGPDGLPVEWMAEWVNAGGRSCDTCIAQGSQPIRALEQIGIRPGETRCAWADAAACWCSGRAPRWRAGELCACLHWPLVAPTLDEWPCLR